MTRSCLHEHFCIECANPFYLHPSCYRGHKYCSNPCRKEARTRKHKVTRLKYDRSPKAKRLSADRQQELRDSRSRKKKPRQAPQSVTTPVPTSIATQNAGSAHVVITAAPMLQRPAQPKSHVTYQATTPHEGEPWIVAARLESLVESNGKLDATILAGDNAGPAVSARVVDEGIRQERAPCTLALRTGTPPGGEALKRGAVPVLFGPVQCCASCGEPGRILRHTPRASRL